MRTLHQLRTSLSTCTTCGHGAGIRPIISHAQAPQVMLVGQAPGKMEIDSGRAFAGRSGRTLFGWLERAGLDESTARERIYIAAITRCYPGPSPSGRGDRVPSREEREACGRWLDAELRLIRPRILIPVGRLAIDRFLGATALDAVVGRAIEVEHAGGRSLAIPLPHPSGASSWVHEAEHRALVDRALELVGDALRRIGTAPVGMKRTVA